MNIYPEREITFLVVLNIRSSIRIISLYAYFKMAASTEEWMCGELGKLGIEANEDSAR